MFFYEEMDRKFQVDRNSSLSTLTYEGKEKTKEIN